MLGTFNKSMIDILINPVIEHWLNWMTNVYSQANVSDQDELRSGQIVCYTNTIYLVQPTALR